MTITSARTIVLLIQRHDDSREMYAEFLRHHRYMVLEAGDSASALTLAPDADVIVTGLMLEGAVGGAGLIAQLRHDQRTSEKPIIVLTAMAVPTLRAEAEAAGCDVFLTKPCLPDVLLREIRRILLHHVRTRRVRGDLLKKSGDKERQRRV